MLSSICSGGTVARNEAGRLMKYRVGVGEIRTIRKHGVLVAGVESYAHMVYPE
jgi:hypothetical protein